MRVEGTATVTEDGPAVRARAAHFLLERGYSAVDLPVGEGAFQRGSLLGTLTSSNPKKWSAQAAVLGGGGTPVRVILDVNTTGQMITDAERMFWDDELGAVLAVIEGRTPAPMRETDRRVAGSAKKVLLWTVAGSLAGGLLFGIVHLALRSFGFEPTPGFPGIGAGIGAAVGAQCGVVASNRKS